MKDDKEMRSKAISIFAAAAGLAIMATSALADDKKDIDAFFSKMSTAFKSKNVDAVYAMATPGFTMTEVGGKPQSGPALKEGLKQWFGVIKTYDTSVVKITDMKIKGKSAVVKVMMNDDVTIPTGKAKTGRLKQSNVAVETLEKSAEGWRVKSIVVTDTKMTLDGKAITNAKLMEIMQPPAK